MSSSDSSRSPSPTSSVSSSHGLYIPVHKRSSGSSASSSRTFSSRASTSSESDSAIAPPTQPAFIYSRDTLLNLAKSPLSRLPSELRDSLRTEVPEIITNRKQRKAIEYHNQLLQNTTLAAARGRNLIPAPARPPTDYRKRHALGDGAWRAM
ncbi:hypothetical protein LshimejAT787_1102210 [Lyophyllum shimeji]|uniref:Uncharacterized protein n=1 Tax=Lyophyllum shimeji TaxID=47721 RepID=A0A9P3UTI8_LYOSH|nr:hypothetical protein LshimejAT787_1102210 [Lyophyllum shimeji]